MFIHVIEHLVLSYIIYLKMRENRVPISNSRHPLQSCERKNTLVEELLQSLQVSLTGHLVLKTLCRCIEMKQLYV